jgi:outer membrane protein assembly factor BamB
MWRSSLLCVAVSALLVASCEKKEHLPGKREAFLPDASMISISPGLPSVSLSTNASTNHKVSKNAKIAWKSKVGYLSSNSNIHHHNGKVFVLNSSGTLCGIDAVTGRVQLKKSISLKLHGGPISGGLSFIDGPNPKVVIATNSGQVECYQLKDLQPVFRHYVNTPVKSSAAVLSDRIVVNSVDNQTFAFPLTGNGKKIWEIRKEPEEIIIEGAGTPAVYGKNVICTYTNGDVTALSSGDGREIWTDTLFSSNTSDSGFVISHIVASPIIYKDGVLVATSEPKMAFIDAFSGIRKWEVNIGTVNQPVINNDWIFVLSSDGTVACISTVDGAVKWLTPIEKKKRNDHHFFGPFIINGEVSIFSSNGEVSAYHPNTGKLISTRKLNTTISRPPVLVGDSIYIANHKSEIVCLR